MRNSYTIYLKTRREERNRTLRRREDIKTGSNEIYFIVWTGFICLTEQPVVGSCEYGRPNELTCYIKDWRKFLD
jgi:hypothetical protein